MIYLYLLYLLNTILVIFSLSHFNGCMGKKYANIRPQRFNILTYYNVRVGSSHHVHKGIPVKRSA